MFVQMGVEHVWSSVRRHTARVALLASSVLLLAASGTALAAVHAAKAPAKRQAALPWATVNIGLALSPPKMVFIGPYVAQQEGFFAREHLKVNFISMPNGLETELGTTAGSIIFGFSSATDSIEAAAQHAPIHAVWSYSPYLDTVCIGGPGITSPKQLKGKNVGSTGTGGFAYTLLVACLKPAGLTPNDVHAINMTRAEFVPAMVANRISAAVFHSDDAWVVTHEDPKLHVLVKEYQTLPQWWYGGVAVRDAYAKAHPDIVIRFLTAMVLADRWIYKHPQATIRIGIKYTGEPRGAVTYAYNFLAKALDWTVNSGLNPAQEAYTAEQLYKFKEIDHIPTYRQVVNPYFIDQVLKKVGIIRGEP